MKVKFKCSAYNPKFGSVNVGDEREVEDELALALIRNDVAEEVVIVEAVNLDDMTVKELKKMLSERELSTKGNKKELIERLKEE